MHADLQRILDDLHANEESAKSVAEGLSDLKVNWQREPGGTWSIAQCLDHLALSNMEYAQAMRRALAGASAPRSGTIRPSGFGRIFIERLEPPVGKKIKAPRKIVPAASKSRAAVMAEFLATHELIRCIIRDGAELDLNRIKFRNPLMPLLRVRVGTGLLIMTAHERRHLWQANRVRQTIEASVQTTT
jgi:hypothetical protein